MKQNIARAKNIKLGYYKLTQKYVSISVRFLISF